MRVQAEISLYPLGAVDPLPAILEFIKFFDEAGLLVEPGPMSTLVSGESEKVFVALQKAWEATAGSERQVMVIKMMA